MRCIAIIPARGGSKSIPRKNLAMLGGKPLLTHAVASGLACPEVSRVIVSTDDPEIAEAGRHAGGEVLFLRPAELAQDDTPDLPVFRHLVSWLRENEGYEFDVLLNLRCTTPLRTAEHVSAVIDRMRRGDCDSVRTVDPVQGKHHPYWMLKRGSEGFGEPFVDGVDLSRYYRRQLLPAAYSINALVDAMSIKAVMSETGPYGKCMALLETDPLYSMDIDNPRDLIVCQALLEKLSELA